MHELPAPPLSLAADPFDRTGLYALLANNTLYHTVDNGETWHKVPLPALERLVDISPDPTYPNALSITPRHDLVITRVRPHRVFVRVDETLYCRKVDEEKAQGEAEEASESE